MNFDITWTITAVIAVSSFLSPVVVSWMNNKHHYKMRKLELQSDLINNQISTLYNDKLTSYKKFIEVAGQYSYLFAYFFISVRFFSTQCLDYDFVYLIF